MHPYFALILLLITLPPTDTQRKYTTGNYQLVQQSVHKLTPQINTPCQPLQKSLRQTNCLVQTRKTSSYMSQFKLIGLPAWNPEADSFLKQVLVSPLTSVDLWVCIGSLMLCCALKVSHSIWTGLEQYQLKMRGDGTRFFFLRMFNCSWVWELPNASF